MKVKDVMAASPVKSCTPETKIQDAAKIMKESNCGALPVIDKENKVIGIITDRDICLSLAEKTSSPTKNTIGNIMHKKVYTVNTKDDILTVFQKMRTHQVGRLPVVDEQGKLKGIVSLHNLIYKSVSDGKEELGNISSVGESLLGTILAVTYRYNENGVKTEKSASAKKHTLEKEYAAY